MIQVGQEEDGLSLRTKGANELNASVDISMSCVPLVRSILKPESRP
jgi:hypothetical protein